MTATRCSREGNHIEDIKEKARQGFAHAHRAPYPRCTHLLGCLEVHVLSPANRTRSSVRGTQCSRLCRAHSYRIHFIVCSDICSTDMLSPFSLFSLSQHDDHTERPKRNRPPTPMHPFKDATPILEKHQALSSIQREYHCDASLRATAFE